MIMTSPQTPHAHPKGWGGGHGMPVRDGARQGAASSRRRRELEFSRGGPLCKVFCGAGHTPRALNPVVSYSCIVRENTGLGPLQRNIFFSKTAMVSFHGVYRL